MLLLEQGSIFEFASSPSDAIVPVGPADYYVGSCAIMLVLGIDEKKVHELGIRSILLNISRKVARISFPSIEDSCVPSNS